MAVSARNAHSSWRLLAVALIFALSTAGIMARLAYLQLLRHENYSLEAEGEHLDSKTTPAHRGSILDRNGNPLATSVDTFDVLVDRHVWQEAGVAAQGAAALGPLLGKTQAEIEATVEGDQGDAVVARQVDYDTGRKIEALGLQGVINSPSSRRVYPEGDLASALLGFLGQDQTGLTGVEHDYNSTLDGKPGVDEFERDSLGNPIAFGVNHSVDAQSGGDVVLTIDRTLQSMAERQLDAAIQKTHADGGDILMMDPQTGDILAMASRPSFQLSKLDLSHAADMSLFRLRAVTDQYEPGSVFKLITTAGAINDGKINPNTPYIDTGEVTIDGRKFHNWDYSTNGRTTITQMLVKSLNLGAIWVSSVLGSDAFYRYVKAFGFGTPTHVGLSGEASGAYRTPDDPVWSRADLASNSFGQGLSATPLQVLTAACVMANGGKLMQPYVVQDKRDSLGDHPTEPVIASHPITAETAATMKGMMKQVVDANALAVVPGYSAAGKSGTAYVPNAKVTNNEKGDAYANEVTIPSYLGFAPFDNPRLAILVKLDDLGTADLGGELTAPIFSKLMHDGLTYLHVPQDQGTNGQSH